MTECRLSLMVLFVFCICILVYLQFKIETLYQSSNCVYNVTIYVESYARKFPSNYPYFVSFENGSF